MANVYATNPERKAKQPVTGIFGLLFDIAKKANELDMGANNALLSRDPDGHDRNLRARTRLIQDLPELLESFEQSEGFVPKEVKDFAAVASGNASRFLESDNLFGMGTLLISKVAGESNDLEALVERLQSPSDTESTEQ